MNQLYIIKTPTHFKIGVSVNPEKRLKELSTGSALPLTLHSTYIPTHSAYQLERRLHKAFTIHRCNGEWFDISCLPEVELALANVSNSTPFRVLAPTAAPCSIPPSEVSQVLALVSETSYVLYSMYRTHLHHSEKDITDSAMAKLLGWGERKVQKHRLLLTKASLWSLQKKSTGTVLVLGLQNPT